MPQMTRREQEIEQVAGIIAETIYEGNRAELQQINEIGWQFDIRYHDGEYIDDTRWTRVEGVKLSAAELEQAIRLAEGWTGERLAA